MSPVDVSAFTDLDNMPPACRADLDKNGVVNHDDFEYGLNHPLSEILLDLDSDGDFDVCDFMIFCLMDGQTHTLGDYNDDGQHDTADLNVLLASYGSLDPCADLNGDFFVNALDLLMMLKWIGSGS